MTHAPDVMVDVRNVAKAFTIHAQGRVVVPVFDRVRLTASRGEIVVLNGRSGTGKSSLLRMLYGNYRCHRGSILVRHEGSMVDVAAATAQQILAMRRDTVGYVSQFLRAVPRVPTVELVDAPLRARGIEPASARRQAERVLDRLGLPARLWALPPATFSGGEQQRVNIARCFATGYPILLLDEPTASLDAESRKIVIGMIEETRDAGTAMLGIFHDIDLRERLATRLFDMGAVAAA